MDKKINPVSESDIEGYLRDQVNKVLGGKAYKFVSPGNTGVPDRLILLPGGRAIFVETKAPGKKPTPKQAAQLKKISDLGFTALVIDSKEKVDELIQQFQR